MFDLSSYRSAVDILEDKDNGPARPRSSTQSYSDRNYRGHSSASGRHRSQYQEDDWTSVPVHSAGNQTLRSENIESNWRSVPNGAEDHHTRYGGQHSQYQTNDRRTLPNGNFRGHSSREGDWMPVTTDSRRVVSSRQTHASNGGKIGNMGMIDVNGGRNQYERSYPEQAHQSTSRLIYAGDQRESSHQRPRRSEIINGDSFLSTTYPDETGRKSSTRLIYDGEIDAMRQERSLGRSVKSGPEERQLLNDVQRELEFQRHNWQDEIERMSGSMLTGSSRSSSMAMKSSFVDTSSGEPRFKAFIDVSEFPPSSVSVNVDRIQNKIIVEARQVSGIGSVAKTFTQKVQMPRFADDTRLSARTNREGILKVEVPLLYYFPEQEQGGQKSKSFVREVHTNPDGSKTMEILVRPGSDVSTRDIRVEVSDNKLVVSVDRSTNSGPQRNIVKKYTLPENADVHNISSHPTQDGYLTILVPIYK